MYNRYAYECQKQSDSDHHISNSPQVFVHFIYSVSMNNEPKSKINATPPTNV